MRDWAHAALLLLLAPAPLVAGALLVWLFPSPIASSCGATGECVASVGATPGYLAIQLGVLVLMLAVGRSGLRTLVSSLDLALVRRVLATAALTLTLALVARMAGAVSPQTAPEGIGWLVGLQLLLVCLIGPLAEEAYFRGWLQHRLGQRVGPMWAVLLTSLMFALMHPQPGWIALGVLFCYSVLWGVAYARSSSLTHPFLAHALHNSGWLVLSSV